VWYVAIGCRAVLAVVFLIAVCGKLAGRGAFREFAASLAAMRVIPAPAAAPVAAITVSAEALVIAAVASPAATAALAGCVLAAGLSAAFLATVAISLRHGNRAPCRCFGRSAIPLGARHLTRNAILLIVAATGAAASAGSGTVQLPGVIVAAGAGLAAGLAIAACDEIAELIAPSH
jgi:hypothetical protein